MMKQRLGCLLAGLVLVSACSDRGLPLDPPAVPSPSVDMMGDVVSAPRGVGTLGMIAEIEPEAQGLVLYQGGFEVEEVPGAKILQSAQRLSVGAHHKRIQVQITESTRIWINGEEVTADRLVAGMEVFVGGRVTGAGLTAELITDLSNMGPPTARMNAVQAPLSTGTPGDMVPEVGVRATSMCVGQTLPYSSRDILQFQGCFGGPSKADSFRTYIPVAGNGLVFLYITRFSYLAGLAGGGFAFPFRFEATPTEKLVYNIPGDVAMKVTPLPAAPALSFWWALGVEVELDFELCIILGDCYDVGSVELSAMPFTARRTSAAAPLHGETLNLVTTTCPSIGMIPISHLPIDPLSIGLCPGQEMDGDHFGAIVTATGANPGREWVDFGVQPVRRQVRPRAMNVDLRFDNFLWVPTVRNTFFFRVDMAIWTIWESPRIALSDGTFVAINATDGFPGPGFSLATHPVDGTPLYHPTSVVLSLDVDPAPTLLTITSSALVPEGSAVTAWLREEYLDTPITGQPVTLHATGLAGSPSTTVTVLTDGTGTAALVLPTGEYRVTATYEGAGMYVPSQGAMDPVYVYRPTTFVIWGGNPGGIVTGGTYQFWGSGWSRQVVGGDFGGNASFQGFAIQQSDVLWSSPPASSARMPAEVPDVVSVIVTTQVTGRGVLSTGNIAGHAILRVENPAQYRPAGGHAGWGVVRAVVYR
jgi:hypothetical protein